MSLDTRSGESFMEWYERQVRRKQDDLLPDEGTIIRQLYDLLEGGGLTATEMQELMGLRRYEHNINQQLRSLLDRGLIVRVQRHQRGRRGRPEYMYMRPDHVQAG